MKRLIVGCGYLGQRVGRLWLERGDVVYALTRKPDRAEALAERGFQPIVGDVLQPADLEGHGPFDTVLYAVGFDRQSGHAMRTIYVDGLSNVLEVLTGEPRIVYISSTGVYGSDDGGWVDESTPPVPNREGGRVCLEAERRLATHRLASRAIVLRMAGIYGPGRIPSVDALRQGAPIRGTADAWLNLIHVEDAAQIVVLAAASDLEEKLLLVSDGCPVMRREFYAEVARLCGTAEPQFERPAPQMRGSANRRISNRRMMRLLRPALKFPDYRVGLAAIFADATERDGGN